MEAILNQMVISMQREMMENDSQNKEELPPQEEEVQHHPSTVILDNWIRVIKKEIERIRLMQKSGFDVEDQKRANELATRIIKRGKEDRGIKRSFWMWERSLNRKAQAKPVWFVLLERKENDVVASSNEKTTSEM